MTVGERVHVEVRLPEGDATNGLGQVMAQYIEQNCADFPQYAERTRRLHKCVVINATDVEVQTTLDFNGGIVTVTSDAAENPDLVLSGDWMVMTDIAAGKRYGLWEGMMRHVAIQPAREALTGARQLFGILKVPRAYLEQRGIDMPPWRILHPVAFRVGIGLSATALAAGVATGMEYCYR